MSAVSGMDEEGNLFTHKIKPIVEKSIKYQLLRNAIKSCKVLNVADLGCGIGSTPIALITTVIETTHKVCKELMNKGNDEQVPETIQIYMSDLPSNEFNMLFKDATKIQGQKKEGIPLCFVMGAPRSFNGRLFPTKSLHFVLSTSALHLLSQVPVGVYNEEGTSMNKGAIDASETNNPKVVASYFSQFERDFTSFLSCRSQEVVMNGQMVLAFPARPSIKPGQQILMNHIFQALTTLVSKGVITQEKLDSFDLPIYFPCKEEIEGIVSKEGSFVIENSELTTKDVESEIKDTHLRAEILTKFLRAPLKAVFSYHFGSEIWNVLHTMLHQVILNYLESNKDPIIHISMLVFVLIKK